MNSQTQTQVLYSTTTQSNSKENNLLLTHNNIKLQSSNENDCDSSLKKSDLKSKWETPINIVSLYIKV